MNFKKLFTITILFLALFCLVGVGNNCTWGAASNLNYTVQYTQYGYWDGGATVDVTIENKGATAIEGWNLSWNFSGDEKITCMWFANFKQYGNCVVVTDSYKNGGIPANGSVSFEFDITYSGTNSKPTRFILNGIAEGKTYTINSDSTTSTPRNNHYYLYAPTSLAPGTYICRNNPNYINTTGNLVVRPYTVWVKYEYSLGYNSHDGIDGLANLSISKCDSRGNIISGTTNTKAINMGETVTGYITLNPNEGLLFDYYTGQWYFRTGLGHHEKRAFVGTVKLTVYTDESAPDIPAIPWVMPGNKNILEMDGKIYTNNDEVNLAWQQVMDIKSNFEGNIIGGNDWASDYLVNVNGETNAPVNVPFFKLSGASVSNGDGTYWIRLKARDYDKNESEYSQPVYVVIDRSVSPVDASGISIQTIGRGADITWPSVSDTINAVAGSGIAGYQVINSPYNITPSNDIADPPIVLEPTKTFPNLTAQEKYYLWLRTTDKVGNISDWVCKEYAIKPEVAEFQSSQCYAIAGQRNGYPLYTFRLKLTKADTVNYIIKRQKYGQPQTLTTFAPIKYVDMQRNGFIFEDSVTESGKYQYFVSTDNVLGQESEQCKSIVCDVSYISVTTGIRSANITWDEMGNDLKGYQTILQTLEQATDNPVQPTNDITNPSPDLKCLRTFDDLTAKKVYCIWLRAIDNNGVPSSWFCKKFSPKPEVAGFQKNECQSISGERDGQLIYGVQFKISENVDAANYLITQEEVDDSSVNSNITFKITNEDMVKSGYKILEGRGLQKHQTYKFSIVTENALGEPSTTADTITKTVENITMAPSQIVKAGPRGFEFNPVINFTLGPQADSEGDELLYRLYVRNPGGVAGTPVATWDPSVDGQTVSYTFADQSSNEWQIRCIEKNDQITDRKEICNPQWNKLEIDSSLKIKVIAKVNGTETNSVTKNQVVSFEILTNSNIQLSNYQWNFGDGTEIATEPIPTHKYADLTQAGKPYQVAVSVADQTGMQQQAEMKLEVVNTSQGELCTDETWSGSHVVKGIVTIPVGTILTISSGTNVMFEAGGQLIVKGKLIAVDPGNTIQFDAQNGSEGWLGIKFEDSGVGQLYGLTIHNAQRGMVVGGSSYVNLQKATLDNNNIGVDYYSGTVTATDCSFTNNWESGVKNNSEVSNPQLIGCTFTGNITHYVDTEGDGSERINTISGNCDNTINN